MEEKFIAAWFAAREKAAKLGVRLRPMEKGEAMKQARRFGSICLTGSKIPGAGNMWK